jgi:hypothetical protein
VVDLRALAERTLAAHLRHTRPDAALLAGSAVTGGADEHSDVDLLLYYDALPTDAEVEAARSELDATDLRPLAPRSDEGLIEQFLVDGTHVQVAHIAVAGFEADLDRLVADPDPYLMKAMQGLHAGLALHGSERIGAWRERGAYTEELQRAVVRRHWKIFPLARLHDALAARDAELFRRQVLVDASFDLLAVLAAANRVWFSSFQLKRTRKLVAAFEETPPQLVDRLEALHALDPRAAADELERLRTETEAILSARGLLP